MSLSVLVTKRSLSVRRYIQNIWKDTVTEQEKGIYCVGGLPFPVQIIETPELSRERNLFLRSLNTGLDEETMAWAIQVGAGDHKMDVSAYVDVIIRANKELLEEMMMLKSSALEEIIEKSGLAARLEERGRREGEERGRREGEEQGRREGEDRRSIEIAKNMIRKGWDSADIAEITGLDLDTVQSLRLPSEDKKP
jgi:predicted transposase/invertase (TIGR01784 family)